MASGRRGQSALGDTKKLLMTFFSHYLHLQERLSLSGEKIPPNNASLKLRPGPTNPSNAIGKQLFITFPLSDVALASLLRSFMSGRSIHVLFVGSYRSVEFNLKLTGWSAAGKMCMVGTKFAKNVV